jgi:hypothetical protein
MTFRCHQPAHGSLAPDQRPFTLASRSHTSVCAPIHRIRSESWDRIRRWPPTRRHRRRPARRAARGGVQAGRRARRPGAAGRRTRARRRRRSTAARSWTRRCCAREVGQGNVERRHGAHDGAEGYAGGDQNQSLRPGHDRPLGPSRPSRRAGTRCLSACDVKWIGGRSDHGLHPHARGPCRPP